MIDACMHACIYVLVLHSILALDPGSHMGSPRQGSSKASSDIVPLDPRSAGQGTRFLLKDKGLSTRVGANPQEDQGNHTQHTRWHLGHEGSQDLGRRVFPLPVSVFSGIQGKERLLFSSSSSRGSFGHECDGSGSRTHLGRRSKGRAGGNNQRKNDETKLGHFDGIGCRKEDKS